MTLPALLFGWLAASLIASLYHLIRGTSAWHLLLYLGLSWTGFAAGQWLGGWLGANFLAVGTLNAGSAVLGSLVLLGLGDWLSHRGTSR